MTKEQYNALVKYDGKLTGVVKTDYIHLSRSEFNEIHEVYKAVFKRELSRSQQNCPRCVVKATKELAQEYVKYKEKLDKKKAKEEKNDASE